MSDEHNHTADTTEQPATGEIVHFNPWRDFNDAPRQIDVFGDELDPEQIIQFMDVVFGYCEGLIPVRSFIDIRLNANYLLPAGSASVTYQAGFSELPNDIKAAIVLRVQLLLDEAATGNSQYLERAEESLIAKYRRYQL